MINKYDRRENASRKEYKVKMKEEEGRSRRIGERSKGMQENKAI